MSYLEMRGHLCCKEIMMDLPGRHLHPPIYSDRQIWSCRTDNLSGGLLLNLKLLKPDNLSGGLLLKWAAFLFFL